VGRATVLDASMKLHIQHRIEVDGSFWNFERQVIEAWRIKDKIIVVFDYMSYPPDEQAKNLRAFNLKQELLWVAEHPTEGRTDTYVHILNEEPLIVSNFASLKCEIDFETGRLKKSVFTK
jgi:hypothetical protein